jgi:GTP-binding protein
MAKPVVAIVGRPNVGKSTLFNRLAGEQLAVVHEIPGTTRDRLVAEADWNGVLFDIVDTGGIDPAHLDPLSVGSKEYIEQIRAHAEMAVSEADAVLFVVDIEDGITSNDIEVAEILRKETQSVLLVVNKCDNEQRRKRALEFFELGIGEPIAISALHGTGLGEMLDELVSALGSWQASTAASEAQAHIAIVGRPNVGKSTLLNRLLGEERAIVSPIPGTTRDAIDTHLTYHSVPITLIDTAGIRRRGKITPGVERFSVFRTLKAIDRSDICLLLIDAKEGVTAQDANIAGMVVDRYKSLVMLVNKWDAVPKDAHTMHAARKVIEHELAFIDYAPLLFISAKTGQRVGQIIPTALRLQEQRAVRIPTAKVNRLVRDAMHSHAPPSKAGKRLRILYASQVGTDPPTFLLHVNDPKLVHFSYSRYLENQIRQSFGFEGAPIRLSYRKRTEGD